MLTVRVIPCLDVEDGRVVKGRRFQNLKDAGDPVALAALYDKQGADEIIFLDVGATYRGRKTMASVVEKISCRIFIPLTVGGGIGEVRDMRTLLQAGADKISICSAALQRPDLITEGARTFGSQCVVVSIDALRCGKSWCATLKGGRENSKKDALEWAREVVDRGAGEILLNSVDRDGSQSGYDLELIRRVAGTVSVPVIASGGAGTLAQIERAIRVGKADAVLAASLLHYGQTTVGEIKQYLRKKGVCVR